MIYFTSDLHFNDDRDYQSRIILKKIIDPEWNNDKNNEFIINSWNKIIKSTDTVIVVGDVSIDKDGFKFMDRLNGKKVLVKGNYDENYDDDFLLQYFESVHNNLVIKEDNLFITHKPEDYDKNFKNIVGHIHGLWRVQEGILNVSLEAWEYMPIPKDLVMKMFENMEKYYDDNVFIGREIYKNTKKII